MSLDKLSLESLASAEENKKYCLAQPYLLANDAHKTTNFKHKVAELSKVSYGQEPSIGIVVGNGYVHSLLPDYPVSHILLCDIDPKVHYFSDYLTQLILTAHNYSQEDFEKAKNFILNHLYDSQKNPYYYKNFKQDYEREIKSLGELHFLSSKNRFQTCVKALQEKIIINRNINLFNLQQVEILKKNLIQQNARISFINLTNLRNYDKNKTLINNLNYLCFQEKIPILWTFIPGNQVSASLASKKAVETVLSTLETIEKEYLDHSWAYSNPNVIQGTFRYFKEKALITHVISSRSFASSAPPNLTSFTTVLRDSAIATPEVNKKINAIVHGKTYQKFITHYTEIKKRLGKRQETSLAIDKEKIDAVKKIKLAFKQALFQEDNQAFKTIETAINIHKDKVISYSGDFSKEIFGFFHRKCFNGYRYQSTSDQLLDSLIIEINQFKNNENQIQNKLW